MARFSTFLTVALAAGSIVSFCLRAEIERCTQNTLLRILLHCSALLAAVLFAYFLNLFVIFILRRQRLADRVKALWLERLRGKVREQPVSPRFEGPLDRTAQVCIWLARPHAVEQAVVELLSSDRADTTRLQTEIDRLSAAARLSAKRAEDLEKAKFPCMVRTLADGWRSVEVVPLQEATSVDDPVYGRISLDEKLATILAHPILRRLNRVKQLSFSYARFPSATHTRLSHSLGVAKNAELALSGMLDRGLYYVQGEKTPHDFGLEILRRRAEIIQKAMLAAILHDIGHGPFGHGLENYAAFGKIGAYDPAPDKRYTAQYIREFLAPTLTALRYHPDQLAAILRRDKLELRGIDQLIADVVDSPLDVDRMDYLVRDAHMTGLRMGFTNTMALIDCMRPVMEDNEFILAYDESASGYMEHFLYARDAMYSNCYEDARKIATERVLTKLVIDLVQDRSLGLDDRDLLLLTDDEVLTVLRGLGSGSELRTRLIEDLVTNQEYSVCHEVEFCSPSAVPAVKNLHENIMMGSRGDLNMVYILQPANWEESIAVQSVGRERAWQIQVLVPSYRLRLQQHSEATVLTRDHEGRFRTAKFFEYSKVMKVLAKEMNPQRNKVLVACPKALPPEERRRIKQAAVEVLGC